MTARSNNQRGLARPLGNQRTRLPEAVQRAFDRSSHAAMLRAAMATRGLVSLVDAVLSQHPTVTLDEVLSPSRMADVAEARAHLAYELYDVARSYPRVGLLLGRHHTSVMDAVRRWGRIVGDARFVEGGAL